MARGVRAPPRRPQIRLQSALVAAITPIAVSKGLVAYTETNANVNGALKERLTEESRYRLFDGATRS